MKNIIFIGAGGFASECYMYLQENLIVDKNLRFAGCLSTSNDLAPYGLENYFLGHYDDYKFGKDDYLVIAIGESRARSRLFYKFKKMNLNFYNLISTTAIVPPSVELGEGNVIAAFNALSPNVKMGNCNLINDFCAIGHDVVIGDFNVVSSYSGFGGFSTLGDGNFLGPRTTIFPKAKIGSNSKISALSVIFKRVRDNLVYFGNPAEVIGQNDYYNFKE